MYADNSDTGNTSSFMLKIVISLTQITFVNRLLTLGVNERLLIPLELRFDERHCFLGNLLLLLLAGEETKNPTTGILGKKKQSFRRLKTSENGREYFENVDKPGETTWTVPADADVDE